MRRNDLTQEWIATAQLLELRPGDVVLDSQTEGDALLPILHSEVTERGKSIGMTFGQTSQQKATAQKEEYGLEEVEIIAAHPIKTPFKDARFHGVVVRHTMGFPALEPIIKEMWRITKSGGKIIFIHTEWNIELPGITDSEQAMLDSLKSKCCKNGRDFFDRVSSFGDKKTWREIRIDVFTVANREKASIRYGYDWRTMLKDQLSRSRRYETRDILDFITKLENTRGSKVSAERYMCLGVKS